MKHISTLLLISCSVLSVSAQPTKVIFRGKVQMADGSAPGKSVGTQRTCSDVNGTRPGPLTNKAGEYIWTMEIDFMTTRRCYIEATLSGYLSTQVEISNVNPAKGLNVDLTTIVLTLKGSNPYMLGGDDKDVPGKGRSEWIAAMKAAGANDYPGAIASLTAATEQNPKFALAWHNLGILNDFQRNVPAAREAYTKAFEANPKMLLPYVALARLQVREKDWQGVLQTTAAAIPQDKGILFPEMFLHQAVAHYNLKDLAAAETAAKAALNPKAKQAAPRAQYVLGRILEAKGDTAGAKEQMNRFLESVPEDAAVIKAHIDAMGTPGAPEPELELLTR